MKINIHYFFIIFVFFISSCTKDKKAIGDDYTSAYRIRENKIYNFSTPLQLIGANAFHSFGAGGYDMNKWNIDIAREFVGNIKENPLTGFPILDANGSFLHPLQEVADSNRINNRITILCPFGWDGQSVTGFTGKRPSLMSFWVDFKNKLKQWAQHFKDQPDVWLEVWNEPYRYDRTDGYTDDIWMNDMNDLVSIIRNEDNNNIILVPCAEQGQDESVLLNRGTAFLSGKKNILFDIHAYEKWLLVTNSEMGNRLQQLKQMKIPVLFGETAPMNAGTLMNPQSFLDSVYNNGLSVCAWVWKYDANDKDALLDINGLPNNNSNNNWGSVYKNLAGRVRRP